MVNARRLPHERRDGKTAIAPAPPVDTVGPPAPAFADSCPSRISATHVAWCWWPLPAAVRVRQPASSAQEFDGSLVPNGGGTFGVRACRSPGDAGAPWSRVM